MLCMDKNMKVHRVYIALTMACLHCIAFIQIVDASFYVTMEAYHRSRQLYYYLKASFLLNALPMRPPFMV